MAGLSSRILDIPEKMIWELATGMEEPFDVAKRYGFDEEAWGKIKDRKDVLLAYERAKAELARTGQTFKNKAKLMSDDLLDNLYKEAISHDTPVKDKIAALQLISKLGELEPKATAEVKGTGFSINISIPSVPVEERHDEVEEKKAEAIDVEPLEIDLPEKSETD